MSSACCDKSLPHGFAGTPDKTRRADIIDQQAHLDAPLQRGQQGIHQLLAGLVGLENIVFQMHMESRRLNLLQDGLQRGAPAVDDIHRAAI